MENLVKYKTVIKKWLHENEEIDYGHSIHFNGYFILRIKENGEFRIGAEGYRKGRFIFVKEADKGVQYLYDSIQLYKDWDKKRKDFSKLSALDTNIYIHLAVSLVDDPISAINGAAMIDVPTVIYKYMSLNPDAKGDICKKMMQKCAGFFLYPYFCYINFYFIYKDLNMAQEAGIAHEMMGRTFKPINVKDA